MTSRWPRVLRGTTTAVVAVLAAAFSHVAAGAPVPGTLGLLLALVLGVPLCVALAGRSLSTPRLVVGVGLSQLALHVLFGLGVGSAGSGGNPVPATVDGGGAAAGEAVGHVHGTLVLQFGDPVTGLVGVDPAGAGMTAGHALAAVLTIVAVRRGEAALLQLAALAGGLVTAVGLLTWRPRPLGPRLRPSPLPVTTPSATVLRHTAPRRGPPRVA